MEFIYTCRINLGADFWKIKRGEAKPCTTHYVRVQGKITSSLIFYVINSQKILKLDCFFIYLSSTKSLKSFLNLDSGIIAG